MHTKSFSYGLLEIDVAWRRVMASGMAIAVHAVVVWFLLTQLITPIVKQATVPVEPVISATLLEPPKPPVVLVQMTEPLTRPTLVLDPIPARVKLSIEFAEPVVNVESVAAIPSTLPEQASSSSSVLGSGDQLASVDTSIGQGDVPVYPLSAIREGWEGTVMVRVIVNRDGQALFATIASSSGYRELDEAARKAILQWRFNAAIRDGRSVESQVLVPFEFKLKQ